ncbi:glycosyltransferase [Dictyobacter aurantiacus]|uniref:Glycosyl transferase n=1 Tax=Dictyobacter aurantiacus TaxID=1936993 RepID=A0A401ZQ96_9CHLR|nr:glycosyltransferase [Dictyobacter aurantiacus]GCE09047.1 hypothetical protein KDAU_63760 [Dictyobacter aurantiacus]
MKMIFPACGDEYVENGQFPTSLHVCMHVVRNARVDIRLQRNATTLTAAGCWVTIVDVATSASQQPLESSHYQVTHIDVDQQFELTRFQRHGWRTALMMFIRGVITLMRQSTDIYHACELTALPACYLAARLRRKPLIFEAYEMPLQDMPLAAMSKSRRLFYGIMKGCLRSMLTRCATVITVSPPIVQELQRRYHIPHVVLLRNLPQYRTCGKTDRLRQHLNLPAYTRIALYQGNIQPDRGLDRLVRAAAYLEPEHVIVIMGQNIGTTRTELRQLIMLQGVDAHIKIIPAVPYDDLLEWTASADLGLSILPLDYTPNVRMCLPNKLFEYLQAGLPVLSSPLEAVREILDTYQVGRVVRSMDPADVGKDINMLLSNADELARMRANALQAARQDLCWEKESTKLLQLYRQISSQQA